MIIFISSTTQEFSSSHMATLIRVSKTFKWFSNKYFKLINLPYRRRKSDTPSPPVSPVSPLIKPQASNSRKDELQEVFRYFDSDGDGKISSLELRAYFASIGEYMSHEEAQVVINDFDIDGDGLIDFQDFMRLMEQGTVDDDLRKAFEMYEVEKGSGCITPKSLQRMLNRLGDTKSYEECVAIIKVFDLDDNGILDFHEFHKMMA